MMSCHFCKSKKTERINVSGPIIAKSFDLLVCRVCGKVSIDG